MAISFNINDIVRVNYTYLSYLNTIQPPIGGTLRTAIDSLHALFNEPCKVLETGYFQGNVPYIRVITYLDVFNSFYNNGLGIIIYFDNDNNLNNCFKLSTGFLTDPNNDDYLYFNVINGTGITLTRKSLVRQTGYDAAHQLPTVDLASAAQISTNEFFGVVTADIAPGATGVVLVEGSLSGYNTSTFAIGDVVYLSDTPGNISKTAGTTTVIIGRVIDVDSIGGAVFFRGVNVPGGDGSGGSTGMGATGVQGLTGLQGLTGIDGIQGLTGLQGLTGPDGIQGLTGLQGLTGPDGFQGITGIFGSYTGLQGATGISSNGPRPIFAYQGDASVPFDPLTNFPTYNFSISSNQGATGALILTLPPTPPPSGSTGLASELRFAVIENQYLRIQAGNNLDVINIGTNGPAGAPPHYIRSNLPGSMIRLVSTNTLGITGMWFSEGMSGGWTVDS